MSKHLLPVLVSLGVIALSACSPPSECADDGGCAEGQSCVSESGRLVCLASCNADRPCPDDEACVLEPSGAAATCRPIEGNLENRRECTEDTQCESGACVGDEGGVKICVETCTGDGDCSDDRCFVVGPRQVCLTPLDDRDDGATCATALECASARCVNLPHIDPDNGLCVSACDDDGACGDGEGCAALVEGGQVCIVLAEGGETCFNDDTCSDGACVIDDAQDAQEICAGECDDNLACDEGFACVSDQDGTPRCLPTLEARTPGETCTSARDCVSGFCGDFSSGGDFGAECAVQCDDAGACEGERVCYQTEVGPGLCGPVPE